MVREEAEQLRDEYLFLIGKKTNSLIYFITDVVSVPVTVQDSSGANIPSGEFAVHVEYKVDGTLSFDDISWYLARKPLHRK